MVAEARLDDWQDGAGLPMRLFRKPEKPNDSNGFPLPFAAFSESPSADYRGVPTYVCPCGYDLFVIAAKFDETQLPAFYLLDGVCASCGALVTVPCPVDGPDLLEVNDGV